MIKSSKFFVRSSFAVWRALTFQKLLSNIRSGDKFGYVQCGIRVPDNLEEKFEAFPPIFKKTLASRSELSEFMKTYAEENKLLTQPQRLLMSWFQLIDGTIIIPFLNFRLDLGLEGTQIQRFLQYAPLKCFNSFVQSAVNTREERDENLYSSVLVETMKLLANS